ncbi:hypothetical protein IF2G_11019 [Cordyceps javanica]|nr:hypothetical protein IF2G_11019 [Cordyceps javanica]
MGLQIPPPPPPGRPGQPEPPFAVNYCTTPHANSEAASELATRATKDLVKPIIKRHDDGPVHTSCFRRGRCVHQGRDRFGQRFANLSLNVTTTNTSNDTTRPFDPFNGIYLLIYQMTHCLLGSYDVANSPRLLAETLAVYDRMSDSSAGQTKFLMMPTLGMLRKLWGGARLQLLFRSIMRDRRKCGRQENDGMQTMMDK